MSVSVPAEKVVFLDFDGVLNSAAFFASGAHQLGDIDPVAVGRLERLLARSRAKVVITSTWRVRYSQEELRARLAAQGFTGEILGVTPEVPPGPALAGQWSFLPRREEIRAWLAAQPTRPERFVILDDADLELAAFPDLEPFFVRIDNAYGLRDEDVEAALRALGA